MRRPGFGIVVGLVIVGTVSSLGACKGQPRDQMRIVGSSAVYPFSTVAAENFGKLGRFKTPVVESTGTAGGLRLFCAGIGPEHPDISNASRPIKESERRFCANNGVNEIEEFTFGIDGISVAVSARTKAFKVSLAQLYLALAAEVPVAGKIVKNPYVEWRDIDPTFPKAEIEVYGPGPVHGTREVFNNLALEVGCRAFPEIAALQPSRRKLVCSTIRDDGSWIDVSDDYAMVIGRLNGRANNIAILPFYYVDVNKDKIQALPINDVLPTADTIASGRYPLTRPLYFYVKTAHIKQVPGIAEYAREFLSDKAAGEDGYLMAKSLVALPADQLKAQRDRAKALFNLKTGS